MKPPVWLFSMAAAALLPLFAQDSFHLKSGDRVVFFGDSITDQRLYTTFVETYAVTRFPDRNITFVHSGWGGDRVTGGGGGGVGERLTRDVLAYKPTVVTIMLGMNDGRVRAFNDEIFFLYSRGYKDIVKQLKAGAPGVRITGIQPSPYDDVTRAPLFPGGYNAVLLKYGQFIEEFGRPEGLTIADLNTGVTAMLAKANAADPDNAKKIIPDRVHPGPSGHLIMAAGLLRAWGAPAVVSSVELDARGRKAGAVENASVNGVQFGQTISWTQTDKALPVPVDFTDPVMALAVNSSDFMDTLNRQTLRVSGLADGPYTLRIDGSEVGTFAAADLAKGINLARLKTPMWAQAYLVHSLTKKHTDVHQARWRTFQVPLAPEQARSMDNALAAMDALDQELIDKQRAAAKPVAHRFELVKGRSSFQPIFNGTDLTGWHISKTNGHGNTQAWIVEDGVLTGAQDRPRNGGILLTDRKYKNFEVQMEVNPTYSCDSGLFLRSNEKGQAYQVMLDYLDGGAIGGVYGEGLKDVKAPPVNWREHWKSAGWNHIRARIEGDTPHIQVWLNGIKITDWTDTANHAADGAVDGMVAVQVHAGSRWIPGGKHRFRAISIRELP